MEMMLWNGLLSLAVAAVLMWIKSVNDENKRIGILLSKTREEGAEKYVTKVEVHTDINRVLDRLDRLENKIDTFMREQRGANS
jgi:Tfp pilus assembly protein PilZ